MLDYKVQADDKSMYNTPPCWAIYMCGLVFAKMRRDGGLAAVQQANEKVRCSVVPTLAVAIAYFVSRCFTACRKPKCCMTQLLVAMGFTAAQWMQRRGQ
jgi:phosphoserine aminotransferase